MNAAPRCAHVWTESRTSAACPVIVGGHNTSHSRKARPMRFADFILFALLTYLVLLLGLEFFCDVLPRVLG